MSTQKKILNCSVKLLEYSVSAVAVLLYSLSLEPQQNIIVSFFLSLIYAKVLLSEPLSVPLWGLLENERK